MATYRIYANRADEFPWSIDSGSQADEQHVQDIVLFDCYGFTMTDFNVRTGDDKTPKWWIEIQDAVLEVFNGVARIYGEDREQ
jgi:hypothetical protein